MYWCCIYLLIYVDTVVLQGLFTASSVRWNAGPEFSQEPVISTGLMHQSTVSRQSRNLTEGMCLMKNMGALMPRKDSAPTDRDSAAVRSVRR